VEQITVLFGGAAGDGVRSLGVTYARVLSRWGWHSFVYDDYQSLIRGGHNFSIVTSRRGERVFAHWDTVDGIVALNQDTVDRHLGRLRDSGFMVYDSDAVKNPPGKGLAGDYSQTRLREIIEERWL